MLVDTSLLVRALHPQHPLCGVAKNAIGRLRLKGRRLYVVPQNLVELWVVATRPAGENGLGMSFVEALAELARVKSFFGMLPETEEIFPAWERLVMAYQVSGKPAHDARLVAALYGHRGRAPRRCRRLMDA
jgi:predicted nucleic acid-binding protein